jgi:hypothetical protein
MSTVTEKPSAADPEYRHKRARKAAAARHSVDAYIRSIVARAPELSDEQRSRLAAILRAGRTDDADGGGPRAA